MLVSKRSQESFRVEMISERRTLNVFVVSVSELISHFQTRMSIFRFDSYSNLLFMNFRSFDRHRLDLTFQFSFLEVTESDVNSQPRWQTICRLHEYDYNFQLKTIQFLLKFCFSVPKKKQDRNRSSASCLDTAD